MFPCLQRLDATSPTAVLQRLHSFSHKSNLYESFPTSPSDLHICLLHTTKLIPRWRMNLHQTGSVGGRHVFRTPLSFCSFVGLDCVNNQRFMRRLHKIWRRLADELPLSARLYVISHDSQTPRGGGGHQHRQDFLFWGAL